MEDNESFYGWMHGRNKPDGTVVAMDGGNRRIVYRKHPDGSPCYAKDPKDCPLTQHHQQAEEADSLQANVTPTPSSTPSKGASSRKVETPDRFKARMADLVRRLQSDGWTPSLSEDLLRAVDDVLDGRSAPARMPAATMRRDRMTGVPKWFLAAYHLATGADNSKTGSWDNAAANRVVEKALRGIGKWTENIEGVCQKAYGKPFGEGSESTVYKAGRNKVVKSSGLDHTGNVVWAMERLMLSNQVFPSMGHRVIGMGSRFGDRRNRPNDHISFLLEQDRFSLRYFKSDKDAERALAKRGFHPEFGDEYADRNEEIRLLDCKRINVPHDGKGNVLFIDPCVILNYGRAGRLKDLSIMGKNK